MKILLFISCLTMLSCKISSQSNPNLKVTKDTLYFNIDKDYLELGKVIIDEYSFKDSINSTEGISFGIEKSIQNLKPKTILNFEEYINRLNKLSSSRRVKDLDNKIFTAFEYNTIIFIDDSNKPIRYLIMRASLFSID